MVLAPGGPKQFSNPCSLPTALSAEGLESFTETVDQQGLCVLGDEPTDLVFLEGRPAHSSGLSDISILPWSITACTGLQ